MQIAASSRVPARTSAIVSLRAPSTTGQAVHRSLMRFAPRLLWLTTLFGLAEATSGILLGEPALIACAALTAGFAAILAIATRLIRLGRSVAAGRLISGAVCALGLVAALLIPGASLASSMLPLLSMVLLLGSASTRGRLALIGLALVGSGLVLLLGTLPHAMPGMRPENQAAFEPAMLLGIALLVAASLADFAGETKSSLEETQLALRHQQALFEGSLDAMLVIDDRRTYVAANPAAVALLGVPQERIVGRPIHEFSQPASGEDDDWGLFLASDRVRGLITVRRPDGEVRIVDAASQANVTPGQHLTVWRDVTDQIRLEDERSMLADAVQQAVDGVAVIDAGRRVVYANASFGSLFGRSADAVLGVPIDELILDDGSPEDNASAGSTSTFAETTEPAPAPRPAIPFGTGWHGELSIAGVAGERRRAEVSVSPLRLRTDRTGYSVLIARDVTRLREVEASMEEARVERLAIGHALRDLRPGETTEATAQAICDTIVRLPRVDFAAIDTFEGPDRVLVLAASGSPVQPGEYVPLDRASYLRTRAADGPWTEIWRERTDEFGKRLSAAGIRAVVISPIDSDHGPVGLLLIGTRSASYVANLVERLPAVLEFTAAARALIGPALEARRNEVALHRRIETVLAERAFQPVFQPIVDLGTGRPIGFEALTRFTDGTRPDHVFAAARRTGLGVSVEIATLNAALRAARRLPPDAWLSLNASPDLLLAGDQLANVLAHRTRPIVLEITEHDPVTDYDALRKAIHALGPDLRVAVDDAGSGIANFAHLVELRPDFVKVDAGLIRGINADPVRQALVVGLLHFAAAAGSQVVAEGIETEAERVTLRELGITYGQGFLMAAPAPVAAWATEARTTATGASRDGLRVAVAAQVAATHGGPGSPVFAEPR